MGEPGPPTLKKNNKIKLRNTPFQKKEIFDGIRIFFWRTSPTHPIYDWSVSILSLVVSLYKTALSRRLLRFHQSGDVIYTTMESFL